MTRLLRNLVLTSIGVGAGLGILTLLGGGIMDPMRLIYLEVEDESLPGW
jgi:hypothetical protein